MKDVPFVNRRYTKRGTFSVKNGIEKGKAGLDLGAEHHRIKLCWVLPPGLEWIQFSTTFSRRALALSLCFQRSNAFHLFWNNGFEIEQFFSHFFKWFSVEVPQYSVLLINTIVFPLWHKCCKVMICRISTPVGGAGPLSRHRHFRHDLNELSVSRSLSVQVYFIEI